MRRHAHPTVEAGGRAAAPTGSSCAARACDPMRVEPAKGERARPLLLCSRALQQASDAPGDAGTSGAPREGHVCQEMPARLPSNALLTLPRPSPFPAAVPACWQAQEVTSDQAHQLACRRAWEAHQQACWQAHPQPCLQAHQLAVESVATP